MTSPAAEHPPPTTSFGQTVRNAHFYYELVMAVISYALNFLLLWLVIKKSPKSMKSYRTIILLSCAVDLVFITLNLICMGLVDMHDGRMFMFSGGVFEDFDHPVPVIMIGIWLFGVNLTVVNIPMEFLFRYSVFCRATPLKRWQFAALYGAFIVWITLHSIGFAVCFITGERSKEFASILQKNPIYDNVRFFIVGDSENLWGHLHMMDIQLLVFVSYGIVVFTFRQISKKLKESREHLSASTLAAQSQLTRIMILQALVPFFVLAMPILLAVMSTIVHANNPMIGFFLACTVAFIPVFNSCCVIVVIPSYRRALFGGQNKLADGTTNGGVHTDGQQSAVGGITHESND
ncbi:Seven TM Receptor [Aphelenchoides fujianensis]|nr:Seven TM Receptor [Aphelenchoides fujianensis]